MTTDRELAYIAYEEGRMTDAQYDLAMQLADEADALAQANRQSLARQRARVDAKRADMRRTGHRLALPELDKGLRTR